MVSTKIFKQRKKPEYQTTKKHQFRPKGTWKIISCAHQNWQEKNLILELAFLRNFVWNKAAFIYWIPFQGYLCKFGRYTTQYSWIASATFEWVHGSVQSSARIEKPKTIQERRVLWIERFLQV